MSRDNGSDDVKVKVAQVTVQNENVMLPPDEIGEIQKNDVEIGQIWQLVNKCGMPQDSGITECVTR